MTRVAAAARTVRLAAAAVAGAAGMAGAQPAARLDLSEPALVVRGGTGAGRAVPVYTLGGSSGAARFVSAADLAAALRGSADVRGDRARVVLAGVELDVADGVPFARLGGREVPLVSAPGVDGGRALLPLQLVVDALPAAAAGAIRFDAASHTLAVVSASPAPAASTAAASAAVTLPSIVGPSPARRGVTNTTEATTTSATSTITTSTSTSPGATAVRRRTVVVDAGHGGVDPGMRGAAPGGPVVLEKDVTLGIARALRAALADRGLDVVLTRDRDSLVALADRGRIANARRGDLFVSVHVNAANPGWRDPAGVRGFETYFLSDARTEEARQVAARENESVRFESSSSADTADPLRFIVSDLAQNEQLRASSRLAAAIQRRLGRAHPGPSRGVHQAGFKVLVTASMPAVLVEVGYGSNAEDAAYITSAAGQRAIAEAIADATVEHLGRYGAARSAAQQRP